MRAQKCAPEFAERWARHVHPRNGKKLFSMLEAYMDESGIHEGAHVCAIAGYYGGEQQWRRFEPRWKAIIKDADTPGLKEFHAHDFWGRTPDGKRVAPYQDWTDEKADEFLADLLTCITEYRLFPMVATLQVSEWNKLNKSERMFLTGARYKKSTRKWITFGAPNKTYFLPFQFCVSYPAEACKEHLKVHYAFDLNKQFKTYALELFELMKKDPMAACRDRMGELSFPTSEEAPGLQAADLLAYQTYQLMKTRMYESRRSALPPVFKKAIQNAKDNYHFPWLDKNGLQVLLWNCPAHLRKLTGKEALPDVIGKLICRKCSKRFAVNIRDLWDNCGSLACTHCHVTSSYSLTDFPANLLPRWS
jgi:hypothetical protein